MRYTSKQVAILRRDDEIFHVLSNFEHFSPIVADKVEGWEATEERCRFKVQGMTVGLRMAEREPNKLIKVVADETVGGMPVPFSFWAQMKDTATDGTPNTHMRLVLDIELNMMMKMLIGGKIQGAMDTIAEQIAQAFNDPRF